MTKELDKAIERLEYINRQYDCNNYYSRYDLDCIATVLQVLKNSIPKEIIEDKKNILEKQYKEALEENSTKAFILKCQIEILKEILEENKDD